MIGALTGNNTFALLMSKSAKDGSAHCNFNASETEAHLTLSVLCTRDVHGFLFVTLIWKAS